VFAGEHRTLSERKNANANPDAGLIARILAAIKERKRFGVSYPLNPHSENTLGKRGRKNTRAGEAGVRR